MPSNIGFVLVLLLLAADPSHLALFTRVMALACIVGVFGHIIKSRTLILTGIVGA